MSGPVTGVAEPRVHSIRPLTHSTYVLRFDRNDLEFEAGQYVAVGIHGRIDMREYSVYSSPDDDFLEILVKEVDGGQVSRDLRRLKTGDRLSVDGPFGFFTIDEGARSDRPLLFLATGTGISPFRCFVRAYPGLDYRLIHGVRALEERYDYEAFASSRTTTCVSRETVHSAEAGNGDDAALFQGRLTEFLRSAPVAAETLCYLCGNCDMIYEAFDILKAKGVDPGNLFAEVYF